MNYGRQLGDRNKMTRGSKAGQKMADALIEFIHLMYQKQTAKRVLSVLIDRLKDRKGEFE